MPPISIRAALHQTVEIIQQHGDAARIGLAHDEVGAVLRGGHFDLAHPLFDGAKGVGEPGCVPSAPAIANAIYDAVGVRLFSPPFTPEKVLAALKAKKGKKVPAGVR